VKTLGVVRVAEEVEVAEEAAKGVEMAAKVMALEEEVKTLGVARVAEEVEVAAEAAKGWKRRRR
jgi:hypothetical protein